MSRYPPKLHPHLPTVCATYGLTPNSSCYPANDKESRSFKYFLLGHLAQCRGLSVEETGEALRWKRILLLSSSSSLAKLLQSRQLLHVHLCREYDFFSIWLLKTPKTIRGWSCSELPLMKNYCEQFA